MPNVANVAFTGTLTISTVMTVTLNDARGSVRVVNQTGTSPIYFTVSASGVTPTAPTVAGADCYVAPAAAGASEEVETGSPPVVVSLISAGAMVFTVETDHPNRH